MAKLIKALIVSNLTLHFGSYKHCFKLAYTVLIDSGPNTYTSLAAA